MKNKKYSPFITIIVLFGLVGTSCSGSSENYSPATSTPLSTNEITVTPSIFSTSTPFPTFTMMPSPTVVTPYPTASAVKANAVAFISQDNSNSLDTALWVANMDGSGERKLVDIAYNRQDGDWGIAYYYLQWSPDGKWISYIEAHALWIISPDGSIKRRLLPLPDIRGTFLYGWSPDSSKIAYLESSPDKPTVTPTPGPDNGMAPYLVGMIDMATGNVSKLSSFEANAGIPILLWSPNERDLLFIKDYSLVLFDVAANKIVKTIKRGCGLERGLTWSPNGKWFSYTDNGVGGFTPTWICVNSAIGGVIHTINVDSTSFNPIWDKTGNYLYFLASKIDLARKPDPLIDERLMRYDARTQETESLLSLKEQEQPNSYIRSFSISPDGNTLILQSDSSQTKRGMVIVNAQSLNSTKHILDLTDLNPPFIDPFNDYDLQTAWSTDSQNLILLVGYHGASFYMLNIKTGKTTIFSGKHSVESWAVSPAVITP